MGRLKELLIETNLNFDAITASKAEARRLLHHAEKLRFAELEEAKDQVEKQPS